MTEVNLNRLVSKLSKMRGAALKMGQFMSIQGITGPLATFFTLKELSDTHVLPEDLAQVFRRVQDAAHYMPNWQMEVLMPTLLMDNGLIFLCKGRHVILVRTVLAFTLQLLHSHSISLGVYWSSTFGSTQSLFFTDRKRGGSCH